MTDIIFTGSGTLSGTSQDGPATVTIDFTPQGSGGGTNSCAPSGASLTNSQGTFSWGTAGVNGWNVLLNGAMTGGSGKQLYLLNGNMFVTTGDGRWWEWQGNPAFWNSVNPPSPLPPACP